MPSMKEITRSWKFMLVYFRLRNYALEAFQFHMMVNSTATPRVADQLKWFQVVNVHGGTGHFCLKLALET